MISGDAISVAVRIGEILDQIGVRYAIGGSIAASIAGEPRGTIDVDVVVDLAHADVQPMLDALGAEFYAPESALRRAIDARGTANLIHQDTNIKVDLFVAGGTPLDLQQLLRRLRVEMPSGQSIYINTPEDILLQKLRWYRRGREVSDRQWRDILGIIRTQGNALDRPYLGTNAPVLNVKDLLERALREADGR